MVSMGVFRISFALLVITAACFAEEGDIENSGYGEMSEDQYRNIEQTLAIDGPEDDCVSGDEGCMKKKDPPDVQKKIGIDSGNKEDDNENSRFGSEYYEDEEDEKEDSVGLLGIFIAIVLSVFLMLGVFNHVIIPFCCIVKKDKKDKEQGGAVLKMSELEKDEKKNTDSNTDLEESKVGSHNEAVEKDIERIESIENENFDRAILNAISAIEVTPEPKKKPAIVNEEYTNTPRNSLKESKTKGKIDENVLNNENLSKGPMPNIKEEAGESDKYQTSDSQTNEEEKKGEQKNDYTASDDESLTTIEKEERVESVANESFDRAILNAVSAIEVSPEHIKKLSDDNRETVAVRNEELNKGPQKEKPSASSSSKDAKEMFRSRKKSTMSIQIEDGNIKNYVEGPQEYTSIDCKKPGTHFIS
eukprot:GFUD01094226.1.p1 GENE.GFUD01094226.1~~GFUD01094226.1.p1  ORF type:complete len:428 (-),score=134.96 GFUD01094226.1:165-1415(-)